MPEQDCCEIGISLGGKYRERVAERPEQQAADPLLEPETERRRDSTVEDGNCAGRPAQEDWLDQGPVDRDLEAFGMLTGSAHEISAPPAKLKNERKKEEAAKAIDRPKMI